MSNSFEIRAQIAAIEGVNINDKFKVEDSNVNESLYLTHYTKDANVITNGQNRGLIVDIKNKMVVCASYGHTTIVIADRIEYPESGKLDYPDKLGHMRHFDKEKTVFKLGVEGFIVRVFLHNGKVYLSTHRKIEVRHTIARWGTSTPFWIMMDELNFYNMLGIDKNMEHNKSTLFPTGKLYSPYVHLFMISHPKMIYVSKQNIGNGYVSYMGALKIWQPEKTNIPLNQIELDVYSPSNLTHDIQLAKTNTYFFVPPTLNLDQVNDHLLNGFYPNEVITNERDPRLGLGEYVVAYTEDKNAWPASIVRIESSAYLWRASIRGEHPNLFYQFFMLSDSAKIDTTTPMGLIEFKRRYPLVNRYDPKEIISLLSQGRVFINWAQDQAPDAIVLTPNDRFYNVWVCYILAVPLNQQYEIALMYYKYFEYKANLSNYLYKLYSEGTYDQIEYNGFATIINNAAYKVNQIYDKNIMVDDNYDEMVKNALNNLVINNDGTFIYKLIKNINSNLC